MEAENKVKEYIKRATELSKERYNNETSFQEDLIIAQMLQREEHYQNKNWLLPFN